MPRNPSNDISAQLAQRAARAIAGGVNSPVRAFGSVGGDPLFIARGEGARVWDVDGNAYVDYIGSWGPLLHGHAHPAVRQAVVDALARGTSFGASTEGEVTFAELLVDRVPALQTVRLVNSGTEACMSALRVARGFTGRDRIVKVIGGYHGHADCLLVRAGSGAQTLGIPDSAGVPAGAAQDTLLLPYNDLDAARELFTGSGDTIAALIIEPVAGNMGTVPPTAGYLEGLRELTTATKSLLIFDEVMTGFRVARGGAHELFGVMPDLVCLGKVIGGGLPLAAYGGRADVMACVAPSGPVYQAGTLSGNPLAVAAGMATLQLCDMKTGETDTYAQLEHYGAQLASGITEIAAAAGIPLCVNRVGSMLTAFFCEGPVTDLASAQQSDLNRFAQFHRNMRNCGVLLPPSQFEAAFISTAHDATALDQTLDAVKQALH